MKQFKVYYTEESLIFNMPIPLYNEKIVQAKNEEDAKRKIENESDLVFIYKVIDIKEI